MKRIKYKYVNSTLMSKDTYLCVDKYVFIELRRTFNVDVTFGYSIIEHPSGDIICQGTAKTLTGIKKCAKMKLIELGAVFLSEVRGKVII